MLKRVISGGQTGVDQAALYAAQFLGIQTGGQMPKGFKTLDGPKPGFKLSFCMEESNSPDYPPRTEYNVEHSDGTIRIAEHFSSAGERCTLKYINLHKKPSLKIKTSLKRIEIGVYVVDIEEKYNKLLIDFIKDCNIQTLNVAGNSELTSPGIFDASYQFLVNIFREIQDGNK